MTQNPTAAAAVRTTALAPAFASDRDASAAATTANIPIIQQTVTTIRAKSAPRVQVGRFLFVSMLRPAGRVTVVEHFRKTKCRERDSNS